MRGIVFDMDGVLLLSTSIHMEAYREALSAYPIAAFDYPAVAGLRTDDAIRAIFAASGISAGEADLAALSVQKSAIARELLAERKPLAPGCREVIRALSEKYLLALASSASKASVGLFFTISGLRDCFGCVLSGADVLHAKPAPEIYSRACEGIGLPPVDCVVIEDAVSGVEAGRAAGARVWGMAGTTDLADSLTRAGAERVIASLYELTDLVRTA